MLGSSQQIIFRSFARIDCNNHPFSDIGMFVQSLVPQSLVTRKVEEWENLQITSVIQNCE